MLDIQVPGRGTVLMETLGDGAVLGWSWLDPPFRWHFGAVARTDTVMVPVDVLPSPSVTVYVNESAPA